MLHSGDSALRGIGNPIRPYPDIKMRTQWNGLETHLRDRIGADNVIFIGDKYFYIYAYKRDLLRESRAHARQMLHNICENIHEDMECIFIGDLEVDASSAKITLEGSLVPDRLTCLEQRLARAFGHGQLSPVASHIRKRNPEIFWGDVSLGMLEDIIRKSMSS